MVDFSDMADRANRRIWLLASATAEASDPLRALAEAIRRDSLPLDAYRRSPEEQEELRRIRALEATRLREQFSRKPWYAERARKAAMNGRDFWMEFAVSYMIGSSPKEVRAEMRRREGTQEKHDPTQP